MYFFFGLFLLICALFCLLFHYRKCKIVRRICEMECCEKAELLNELTEPFGFSYVPSQDIMTSRLDAWQRQFGYCTLYDRLAVRGNMVFDCEPVYFNYQDRTWLIEFWKGQYGINTGAEIGIYQADGLIAPGNYGNTLFQSVPDSQMLPVSMELFYQGNRLFKIRQTHWWLTGFCMGYYCEPEDLLLHLSITFPDNVMLQSFVESLLRMGYRKCDLKLCGFTVTLCFTVPCTPQPRSTRRLRAWFAQWKNRIFCRIFCRITRPFTCTRDQILYLYFYLPFAFRRMLCLRKNAGRKKQRLHRRDR